MKIACLQFAPEVGDVDNNLSRADAVLGQAGLEELDHHLDLLVLPELAFTGYNFKSLQQISPHLEVAGSGITSLWARTTALKHDCTVVIGYPEKADISSDRPTSPGYYNSALLVNGDGDIIGNYRKSFLYDTDEVWALEGTDGFFKANMPPFGNIALGICTDINPYRLEAPWDAFEFGYHVLEVQANVVILTMAWQTDQDSNSFHRSPKEPDLETLVYWVQRLEPLIRADNEDEIIVIFCNRTGTEGDATFTGTSAVIGVRLGEVFVYGVLGRGESKLLVVDTNLPPRSKLTDAEEIEADQPLTEEATPDVEISNNDGPQTSKPAPSELPTEELQTPRHLEIVTTNIGPVPGLDTPRKASASATSPRLPWLALPDELPPDQIPANNRSPTRLQIPASPDFNKFMSMDSAITDIIVDSPDPGSPDGFDFPGAAASTSLSSGRPINSTLRPPRSARMRLSASDYVPASPGWRFLHSSSSRPGHRAWHCQSEVCCHTPGVFGGGATMTPITPFDDDSFCGGGGVGDGGGGGGGGNLTPIDPKPPGWFWRHEPRLSALAEAAAEEDEEEEEGERGKGEKGKEAGEGNMGLEEEGKGGSEPLPSLAWSRHSELERVRGAVFGEPNGSAVSGTGERDVDDAANNEPRGRAISDDDARQRPSTAGNAPAEASETGELHTNDNLADLADDVQRLRVSQRPSSAATSGLSLHMPPLEKVPSGDPHYESTGSWDKLCNPAVNEAWRYEQERTMEAKRAEEEEEEEEEEQRQGRDAAPRPVLVQQSVPVLDDYYAHDDDDDDCIHSGDDDDNDHGGRAGIYDRCRGEEERYSTGNQHRQPPPPPGDAPLSRQPEPEPGPGSRLTAAVERRDSAVVVTGQARSKPSDEEEEVVVMEDMSPVSRDQPGGSSRGSMATPSLCSTASSAVSTVDDGHCEPLAAAKLGGVVVHQQADWDVGKREAVVWAVQAEREESGQ
ncbi:hypothetical protein VTK26DRAFT_8155 [Humicola hyalothermophila]